MKNLIISSCGFYLDFRYRKEKQLCLISPIGCGQYIIVGKYVILGGSLLQNVPQVNEQYASPMLQGSMTIDVFREKH
jgi:hypothetical protein